MKSPPSDQIWFGFLSMPDIDFNLEPFVGDHKITSGRLALFLINRFKVRLLACICIFYNISEFQMFSIKLVDQQNSLLILTT